MLTIRSGDMFSEPVEALVNTVNCVGAMGKGLALTFRKMFPDNYLAYAEACARRRVVPGRMFVFDRGGGLPRWIINFPTKRHWRDPSRLEDIDVGLGDLAEQIRVRGMGSVAVPALGCGLGGLSWSEVLPLIEKHLSGLDDVRIVVFSPGMEHERKPTQSASLEGLRM